MRILVVEDDDLVSRAITRVLLHEGHSFFVAGSGEDALIEMSDGGFSFDAIISDVDMPGMGGIGFYKVVCSKYPHLKGRFGFMTGNASVITTLDAPCAPKPCGYEEIRNLIRTLTANEKP